MKTIILAIVAALALGAGAAFVLSSTQRTAFQAYSTSGARVSPTENPNLVGPRWTGTPDPRAPASPG